MRQNLLEWDYEKESAWKCQQVLKEKKSEALSKSQENSCWTWGEKILFSHENIRVLKVRTLISIFGLMMKVIKVQALKQKCEI